MGILVGLSYMQGYMTWSLHQKRKPYLLAFSFLMFWQSAVLLTEALAYILFGKLLPENIIICLDYLIAPLFYLEVLCITRQDTNIFTWKQRWGHTLLSASPLPIFYYLVFTAEDNKLSITAAIFGLLYILSLLILMYYHLHKFRSLLKKANDKSKTDKQDIRWVTAVFSLMAMQYLIYICYDWLPDTIIYFVVSYVQVSLHGYFIRKTAPTNTNKLIAMNEEMMEKRQEAIDDLKDATEGLKRRLDMDTALKAFRIDHPSFESRLRDLTDVKLTKRDIMLCVLIYEGKRIPEIADFFGISATSVEVARHRLRTKLNMERGDNLNRILQKAIDE